MHGGLLNDSLSTLLNLSHHARALFIEPSLSQYEIYDTEKDATIFSLSLYFQKAGGQVHMFYSLSAIFPSATIL